MPRHDAHRSATSRTRDCHSPLTWNLDYTSSLANHHRMLCDIHNGTSGESPPAPGSARNTPDGLRTVDWDITSHHLYSRMHHRCQRNLPSSIDQQADVPLYISSSNALLRPPPLFRSGENKTSNDRKKHLTTKMTVGVWNQVLNLSGMIGHKPELFLQAQWPGLAHRFCSYFKLL